MWRRGADKDGNVANFVETEQVLEAEGFVASYVQVYFSPAYLKWAKWSQACSSIFLRYCLPILYLLAYFSWCFRASTIPNLPSEIISSFYICDASEGCILATFSVLKEGHIQGPIQRYMVHSMKPCQWSMVAPLGLHESPFWLV